MRHPRLLSMLCAIAVGLALAIPVFAVDAAQASRSDLEHAWVAAPGEVHCQEGDRVGTVVATDPVKAIVGYEKGNCTHGVVGKTDIKYQYQEKMEFSCTLCDHGATIGGNPYWGRWSCQ